MSTQQTVEATFIQFLQAAKLVGTNSWGDCQQGAAVAVSADGHTAVVGGPNDYKGTGAIWIFTTSEGVWSQQGGKLVPTNCIGASGLGSSVAISADGNTVIAGGPGDSNLVGAAWIFTRTGGEWSEQAKLVATNYLGGSGQGSAVAISADGKTCAVGGGDDDDGVGAAWIFSSSNGPWAQVKKLIGSGYTACKAGQGSSLAMSADGKTLIIGSAIVEQAQDAPVWVFTNDNGWQQQGNYLTASGVINNPNGQNTSLSVSADGKTFILGEDQDNGQVGAAWIFTCDAGVWRQQGGKLVGTGAIGNAAQGGSVAISGDGKTAMVGGGADNGSLENGWVGAAWVYQRNGNNWSQIGKIVGMNAIGNASQGTSVALSANGFTLLSGGTADNNLVGATWVFNKVYTPS